MINNANKYFEDYFDSEDYRKIEDFALVATTSENGFQCAASQIHKDYGISINNLFDGHDLPQRILNYCWDLASKSEFFFVDIMFLNERFPEEWRKPEHIFQGLLDFFECAGIIEKCSTYHFLDDALVQRPVYTFVDPKPHQIMKGAS